MWCEKGWVVVVVGCEIKREVRGSLVKWVSHNEVTYNTDAHRSRNNGFAISTPTKDQYKGDGIGWCALFSHMLSNHQ